ncbi:glycosyltransferase family 4 protein [Neptuniibacter caesariensis]|uniref:Glycosyltransferase n=1 Tax=Neptuniibacter caesariensis TaxID=207954 RepID=A0A7U8GT72_NEPCE|nr:glycosyltransferase family 4 protein [Neptuniibacter caesariensis]EAR62023.1 glycosyltransferase [Oceanospirillum sp. MED92] [Neptuniibacter caesariensis]
MFEGIRIYQLVDSRSYGGIESHILNLSKWLKRNNLNSEVVFLRDYGAHPLKQELDRASLRYRSLNNSFQLVSLLKESPSLLCTHGYKAGIIGRLAALSCKRPVISTFHSGDPGKGRVKLYSLIDRYSAFLCDALISVSHQIAEEIPESTTIANFVPQLPMLPERGKAIAFVGRLSEEKDPISFAKTTQTIDAPCHVYGDGPLYNTLQDQYPHLTLFGHVEMRDYWKDIGLLCITSRFEGLPLVALEAMIRGIPVLSFAIGGLPDLIKDSENGWIIQNRDEDLFNKAICHWLALPATAKASLSISAHHHAQKHYSDESVCPQILSIYENALAARCPQNSLAKR